MPELPPRPGLMIARLRRAPDMAQVADHPGAPRWVKVSWLAVIVTVLLLGILMVLRAGDHGPGRHLSPGEIDRGVPPAHAPDRRGPTGRESPGHD